MGAATAHLGNIKDVKIIDFGGNGGDGGSSTGKFGTVPVEVITKFTEGLKGTGMDLSKLLGFIGMKPEDLGNLGTAVTEASKAPKPDKK